ncbi:zinc ribbon domain-containing protein, partial [Spirulina sp. CCNP1310]|uniref:zinc ribbon domain-containing protein n=1 Tax=Spirulina sp. CCNP1310 TaxID=3110249 RepID=UPI002B209009
KRVQKALSVRTHHCPHCGYEADRDVNAAINILRLGLTTVGHTVSYTLGEIGPLAELEKSCSVKSGL